MLQSYSYRCLETFCGELTWANHQPDDRPEVKCSCCGSVKTRKVIVQVPYMKPVLTPMKPAPMRSAEA